MKKRKPTTKMKYANGTGAAGYIPNPGEVMAEYDIMLGKVEQKVAKNKVVPIIQGVNQLVQMGAGAAQSYVGGKKTPAATTATPIAPADYTGTVPMTSPNQQYQTQDDYLNYTQPIYAYGGETENGPIEVEGGETVQAPGGPPQEVEGPPHEEGGVDMDVPQGTIVYSDRLKKDGKTMAERKEARDAKLSKLTTLLDKNKTDLAIKNSANRRMQALQMEDQQDLMLQDMANQYEQIQEVMAYGTGPEGIIKYAYGTDPYGTPPGGGTLTDEELTALLAQSYQTGNPVNAQYGYDTNYAHNMQATTGLTPGPWGPKSQAALDKYRAENNVATKGLPAATRLGNTFNAMGLTTGGRQYLPEIDTTAVTTGITGTEPTVNPLVTPAEYRDTNTGAFGYADTTTTPAGTGNFMQGVGDFMADAGDFSNKYIPRVTGGDMATLYGTWKGATDPLKNTLENRAGDRPNINAFRDYGKEGLAALENAKGYIGSQRDQALSRILASTNAARRTGRNTARGVNTMRALDIASELGKNQADAAISGQYAQQMMGIIGQEAQMENMQDQAVMTGEQARDLADRQDRDNFYTQKGKDLATRATGYQQFGKNLNQISQNEMYENLLNQMGKYFKFDKSGKLINANPSTQTTKSLADAGINKDANGNYVMPNGTVMNEEQFLLYLSKAQQTP